MTATIESTPDWVGIAGLIIGGIAICWHWRTWYLSGREQIQVTLGWIVSHVCPFVAFDVTVINTSRIPVYIEEVEIGILESDGSQSFHPLERGRWHRYDDKKPFQKVQSEGPLQPGQSCSYALTGRPDRFFRGWRKLRPEQMWLAVRSAKGELRRVWGDSVKDNFDGLWQAIDELETNPEDERS